MTILKRGSYIDAGEYDKQINNSRAAIVAYAKQRFKDNDSVIPDEVGTNVIATIQSLNVNIQPDRVSKFAMDALKDPRIKEASQIPATIMAHTYTLHPTQDYALFLNPGKDGKSMKPVGPQAAAILKNKLDAEGGYANLPKASDKIAAQFKALPPAEQTKYKNLAARSDQDHSPITMWLSDPNRK